MSTLPIKPNPIITDVSITDVSLHVILADGREIFVPLEWFPRLKQANDKSRNNWRLIGHGIGIHWEDIDEDIAVETLLKIS